MNTNQKCGSELARDSSGSGHINADCSVAIASKLAPTGSRGGFGICGKGDLFLRHIRHKSAFDFSAGR
ncbi:hypothetical protein C0J56_28190 [Pseudomonas fluorescens]|nr:hypothetical protein C0J56_28190 [Pseudomonas fluorescens]